MSHIHLPDGILPAWLWVSGYLLAGLLIGILWRRRQTQDDPGKFASLGIFSAIMILVMMVEVPPFSYHFNLSVVAGIILGPQSAVLAALIVNIVLALIGHGGITTIGLNTLLLSIEMIVGYYVFRMLRRLRVSLVKAGFIATIAGLAAGASAGYGIIFVGSPWIDRFLRSASSPGEELGPGIEGASLNLVRLAVIMFGIGAVGWILEGILSAAILSYLAKVYPGLIDENTQDES